MVLSMPPAAAATAGLHASARQEVRRDASLIVVNDDAMGSHTARAPRVRSAACSQIPRPTPSCSGSAARSPNRARAAARRDGLAWLSRAGRPHRRPGGADARACAPSRRATRPRRRRLRLARSGADDRVERARLVVADMRAAEVAPRRPTLRALPRGGPTDLSISTTSRSSGCGRRRPVHRAARRARTARGSAEPRRVPPLLQVMRRPARGARRGSSSASSRPPTTCRGCALLPPQLPQHKLAPHIRHALPSRRRVDRPAAARVQRALRTGDAPPADAALRRPRRPLRRGEARAALALLRSLWRHGGRMSERTARRVLVGRRGVGAARRRRRALDSIRDAMFGESRNADRAARRRGAAAEHEATRG